MPLSNINLVPVMSSYYFATATNNGLNVLGQATYRNQIRPFQFVLSYFAKALTTDPVSIQIHSYYSGTVTLHLCDRFQRVITAADAVLNAAPAYKGLQVVTGNTFTDPYDGSVYGLTSSMWDFNWTDLLSFITSDTPTDFYYFKLVADTIEMYSEPILVRTPRYDNMGYLTSFNFSSLFNAQWLANKSQNTNVVVSGWFNDFPTNTVPYFPSFYIRCEATIMQDDPNLVAIAYLRQQYEQQLVTGQQVPRQILKLGLGSLGIPDYMLQMISEIVISDRFSITQDNINYYQYKLWSPSPQTSPSAIWKTTRIDNDASPLLYATLPITLGSLSQQAMVDPDPTPSARIYSGVYSSVFA